MVSAIFVTDSKQMKYRTSLTRLLAANQIARQPTADLFLAAIIALYRLQNHLDDSLIIVHNKKANLVRFVDQMKKYCNLKMKSKM